MRAYYSKPRDRKRNRSSKSVRLSVMALALTLTCSAAWTLIAAEFGFGSLRSIQTVVARGDPSPLGGALASVDEPVLLSSSEVAFVGSNEGVFVHGPQGLSEIAVSGDVSPGGEPFNRFQRPSMSSDPGLVVFRATLDDGDHGIFLWDDNSVLAVAVEDAVSWQALNPNPAVNRLGHVAFVDGSSLFFWDGSFTRVAAASDANPCGGQFSRIPRGSSGGPSVNDSGVVVFGNSGFSSNVEGIFAWDGFSISAIACSGDPTPAGGTFDSFGYRPIINDSGDVVFVARLTSHKEGLFLYSGGVLTLLALEGEPSPAGWDFGRIDDDLRAGLNASGDVAFVAGDIVFLYSGGVGSEVISQGDPCPTGGSFGRILSESVSLNDDGEVSFEATCAAGRGLFRSRVGGPATLLVDESTPTSIGPGFRFRQPTGTSANTIAFWGKRYAIIQAHCGVSGCGDFETVVAPGDPVSELPSLSVSSFTFLTGSKGAVVFEALLSGGARPGEYGLFIHRRGSIQNVARYGDPLPKGEGVGVLYPTTYDGIYNPSPPSENRGRVAFLADVNDPGNSEFWQGIFVNNKGKLRALARAGDPAPGGGTLTELAAPSISGNRVVFAGRVDGEQLCIFRFSLSGTQERFVCTGDPAPAPLNGTFEWLEPAVASGSRTYFTALLSDSSSAECLFVHQSGRLEILACDGDPLPGGGVIKTFLDQDYYYNRISASGSRVVTPIFDEDYLPGFMVFEEGLGTPVGFVGDPAPLAMGGTFASVWGPPSLWSKQVVFLGWVIDGNKDEGVFLAKTKR